MKRKLLIALAVMITAVQIARAQSPQSLAARIEAIINRSEYRHAIFGMEFYSLNNNQVLYAMNADKLFVPGSVTKIVTEAAVLQLLGPDYRFHTRVYRTGPISNG